jgi:uncharacterized protein YjbJ (UPF0337 family)
MTDDRISGSAKNIGGQLEEGFGRVTGDEKMQLEGRARQAEGTLQDVYGQAKETAVDATGAIRDRAGEASDFLREIWRIEAGGLRFVHPHEPAARKKFEARRPAPFKNQLERPRCCLTLARAECPTEAWLMRI